MKSPKKKKRGFTKKKKEEPGDITQHKRFEGGKMAKVGGDGSERGE